MNLLEQQTILEIMEKHKNGRGAWFITVEIDDEGTLTRVIPEQLVQYKKIDSDYLNFKKWK